MAKELKEQLLGLPIIDIIVNVVVFHTLAHFFDLQSAVGGAIAGITVAIHNVRENRP